MRLSASKVDCFYGCKRQFRYRYLQKPFPEPPVPWFLIGNIAHYALEMFYKNKHQQETSKKKQKKALTGYFREAIEKYKAKSHIRSGLITKENIADIRKMLKDYLVILPNVEGVTEHTEQYFNIDIDGVEVSGKADRIDRLNDEYLVVDYKTSKKAKFDPESVQLPTYAIWLMQRFNIPLDQMKGQYYYLRHLTKKSGIGIQDFPITEKAVEDTKKKYQYVRDAINNEDFEYTKNTEHYCFTCPYKTLCIRDNNDYLD